MLIGHRRLHKMKKLFLAFLLTCFLAISSYALSPPFLQTVSSGGTCAESDTFTGNNGDAPNSIKWTESDVGNYLDIQSNKLNFSYDGDALSGSYIISNFYFAGDFDIQIDFDVTILEQPDAGISYCPEMRIRNSDDSVNARIVRYHNNAGVNQYYAQGSTTGWDGSTPTAEDAAKIRFVRSGSTLTGYVWDPDHGGGARWEWDDNAAGKIFDETFDMNVYIKVFFNHPNTTAASEVTGNVDNFTINSGSCYY